MIVSFSVSNFRSFFAEETFSLAASSRLAGGHDDHAVPIPHSDHRVLRTGVIYGANGAGKSNLFKALRHVRSIALGRRAKGTARTPSRLAGSTDDPSSFDLKFIAGERLYRFAYKADDLRIREEWLAEVIGGREEIVYERVTSEDGQVTVSAPGLMGHGEKLLALTKVGGPQNQSFLATVNLTLNRADYGEHLESVLNWFREGLVLIGPESSFGTLGRYLADNPAGVDLAGEVLRSASTGVDHLQVARQEITEDELRSLVPPNALSCVLENASDDTEGKPVVSLGDVGELLVERAGEDRFYRISVRAVHHNQAGGVVSFGWGDESDGTRRLLNLLPALHPPARGESVFVIDEIDRSLHPNLVREFMRFFLQSSKRARAQVIVSTHESNLLDLDLLRRDEIWFAEKDLSSATRLYALTDFSIRKDREIRKHYLRGRFGAVPFLGELERLLGEADPSIEPA